MGKKGPEVEGPWMEGAQEWRRHRIGGMGRRAQGGGSMAYLLQPDISPQRVCLTAPIPDRIFFSTQALIFFPNHLRGPRSVTQALNKPFALRTIR